MGIIQNAINRILGTGAGLVTAAKIAEDKKQAPQSEDRMKQSLKKVAKVNEAKQTQRRNFMNYLKTQSTSFGGTVGDLPMNVQKEIAKQYSPKERKTLMDKIDKESKK